MAAEKMRLVNTGDVIKSASKVPSSPSYLKTKLKKTVIPFVAETVVGISVLILAYVFFFKRIRIELFKDNKLFVINPYQRSVLTALTVCFAHKVGGPTARLIDRTVAYLIRIVAQLYGLAVAYLATREADNDGDNAFDRPAAGSIARPNSLATRSSSRSSIATDRTRPTSYGSSLASGTDQETDNDDTKYEDDQWSAGFRSRDEKRFEREESTRAHLSDMPQLDEEQEDEEDLESDHEDYLEEHDGSHAYGHEDDVSDE